MTVKVRYALLAAATLLCAAGVGLAAPDNGGPAYRTDAGASFQDTECWGSLDTRSPTKCGWLTVPERWDSPGDKMVQLPVVIYRPAATESRLAPVIYLSGGPGYPALGPWGTDIAAWRRLSDQLFPGRLFILFDQRGSGLGAPRLDCPEVDDPQVWWDLSPDPSRFVGVAARLRDAYGRCRDRLLAQGIDLGAYNSRQSAADVEALRRALGLGPVVLFGLSYGTRLALTTMRHYPDSVAAAVLDSVLPPQAISPNFDSEAYAAALDRLFAACADYPDCAAAYPNLAGDLAVLLDRLSETPVVLEVDNLKSFAPLYARVDQHLFLAILRREMQRTASLSRLPSLIAGMAQGDDWRLRPHAENIFYGRYPRDYDMGMSFSVACHDLRASRSSAEPGPSAGRYPYLKDHVAWIRGLDVCPHWPAGEAHPSEAEPVVSAVPSLLLAGALDASTTLEQAEAAAETLERSHLFVFSATAHNQLASAPCAREVLQEFLADPEARPNPPCLATQRRPAFLALGLR